MRLKVAATGKSARVTWSCGTGRAPSTLQFAIKADENLQRVQQHRHADGVVVRRQIRLPKQVRAVLHLNTICDGKGGPLNLALKA